MADLDAQFQQAVSDSRLLPKRPDNMTLLKLYALYKQGCEGDVQGQRPGFAELVARAKWDAWAGVQGMASEVAQQQYIDLVNALKQG